MVRWLRDFRWALNMARARKFRNRLLFSGRKAFDNALQHRAECDGYIISYPDAFYLTTAEDVSRAMLVTHHTSSSASGKK